jgi:hypothetical protein
VPARTTTVVPAVAAFAAAWIVV